MIANRRLYTAIYIRSSMPISHVVNSAKPRTTKLLRVTCRMTSLVNFVVKQADEQNTVYRS